MRIHLEVRWYERNADFSPNYNVHYQKVFEGDTPSECVRLFREFMAQHDLRTYTNPELWDLY